MRAPLVEAEQNGSIGIQYLTKIVMARRRLWLTKERLVPFEAGGNVAYTDDRPGAFHRIYADGLTSIEHIKLCEIGGIARGGMSWGDHECNR